MSDMIQMSAVIVRNQLRLFRQAARTSYSNSAPSLRVAICNHHRHSRPASSRCGGVGMHRHDYAGKCVMTQFFSSGCNGLRTIGRTQARSCGSGHLSQQQQQQKHSGDDGSCFVAAAVRKQNEEAEGMVLAEVRKANESCLGHIQILEKSGDQWGVFSSRAFAKGSTVVSSRLLANNTNHRPNPSPTSCSHTIQIDWEKHILMDLPARFLNHSCDPNIGVAGVNEGGSYDFLALRNIAIGEEIRFDYETTEYEVGAFAECCCGASDCRGIIRGYRHNAEAILAKYGKNVAEYLAKAHEGVK